MIQQEDSSAPRVLGFQNGSGSGKYRVYAHLHVGRSTVQCLIDTGCEASLVPLALVKHINFDRCTQAVTAANGSTIRIIGSKRIYFHLNNVRLAMQVLISDDIDEAMLGIDFIVEHRCITNFVDGYLVIHGQRVNLHARRSRLRCR